MSIAAQLRVLASAERKLGTPNARPSFLFDPQVAAETDTQTIYNLSRNGLTALVKENQVFLAFESTLFARMPDSSYLVNLSAEDRKKLDASISMFLRVLSPYFLNKAAHKCLEFLIRCYSIQVYNVEAVLQCIMPFHETAIFARMLSLLNLDNAPRFEFLRASQKSNAPLARATLVKRCLVDRGILSFVADFGKPSNPIASLQGYLNQLGIVAPHPSNKHAVAFFTTTMADVLASAASINDALVSTILPTILHIFTPAGSHSPEHQTAAYMIFTQLCSRTHLAPRVLNEVLGRLCQSIPIASTPHMLQFPLMCLLAVMHSQKAALLRDANPNSSSPANATKPTNALSSLSSSTSPPVLTKIDDEDASIAILPQQAFAHLVNLPSIIDALVIAADKYDVSPLLWPLLRSLMGSIVTADEPSSPGKDRPVTINISVLALVEKALASLPLGPRLRLLVFWLVRAIVNVSSQVQTTNRVRTVFRATTVARQLLLRLDTLYSHQFDFTIHDLVLAANEVASMSSLNDIATRVFGSVEVMPGSSSSITPQSLLSAGVLNVINSALQGTRHELMGKENTTLLLAFKSETKSVRASAFHRLSQVIQVNLNTLSGHGTQGKLESVEEMKDMNSKKTVPSTGSTTMGDGNGDDDADFLMGSLLGNSDDQEEDQDEKSDEKETLKTTQDKGKKKLKKRGTKADDVANTESSLLTLNRSGKLLLAQLAGVETDVTLIQNVLNSPYLLNTHVIARQDLVDHIVSLFDRVLATLGIHTAANNHVASPTTDFLTTTTSNSLSSSSSTSTSSQSGPLSPPTYPPSSIHSLYGAGTVLLGLIRFVLLRLLPSYSSNSTLLASSQSIQFLRRLFPYVLECSIPRTTSLSPSLRLDTPSALVPQPITDTSARVLTAVAAETLRLVHSFALSLGTLHPSLSSLPSSASSSSLSPIDTPLALWSSFTLIFSSLVSVNDVLNTHSSTPSATPHVTVGSITDSHFFSKAFSAKLSQLVDGYTASLASVVEQHPRLMVDLVGRILLDPFTLGGHNKNRKTKATASSSTSVSSSTNSSSSSPSSSSSSTDTVSTSDIASTFVFGSQRFMLLVLARYISTHPLSSSPSPRSIATSLALTNILSHVVESLVQHPTITTGHLPSIPYTPSTSKTSSTDTPFSAETLPTLLAKVIKTVATSLPVTPSTPTSTSTSKSTKGKSAKASTNDVDHSAYLLCGGAASEAIANFSLDASNAKPTITSLLRSCLDMVDAVSLDYSTCHASIIARLLASLLTPAHDGFTQLVSVAPALLSGDSVASDPSTRLSRSFPLITAFASSHTFVDSLRSVHGSSWRSNVQTLLSLPSPSSVDALCDRINSVSLASLNQLNSLIIGASPLSLTETEHTALRLVILVGLCGQPQSIRQSSLTLAISYRDTLLSPSSASSSARPSPSDVAFSHLLESLITNATAIAIGQEMTVKTLITSLATPSIAEASLTIAQLINFALPSSIRQQVLTFTSFTPSSSSSIPSPLSSVYLSASAVLMQSLRAVQTFSSTPSGVAELQRLNKGTECFTSFILSVNSSILNMYASCFCSGASPSVSPSPSASPVLPASPSSSASSRALSLFGYAWRSFAEQQLARVDAAQASSPTFSSCIEAFVANMANPIQLACLIPSLAPSSNPTLTLSASLRALSLPRITPSLFDVCSTKTQESLLAVYIDSALPGSVPNTSLTTSSSIALPPALSALVSPPVPPSLLSTTVSSLRPPASLFLPYLAPSSSLIRRRAALQVLIAQLQLGKVAVRHSARLIGPLFALLSQAFTESNDGTLYVDFVEAQPILQALSLALAFNVADAKSCLSLVDRPSILTLVRIANAASSTSSSTHSSSIASTTGSMADVDDSEVGDNDKHTASSHPPYDDALWQPARLDVQSLCLRMLSVVAAVNPLAVESHILSLIRSLLLGAFTEQTASVAAGRRPPVLPSPGALDPESRQAQLADAGVQVVLPQLEGSIETLVRVLRSIALPVFSATKSTDSSSSISSLAVDTIRLIVDATTELWSTSIHALCIATLTALSLDPSEMTGVIASSAFGAPLTHIASVRPDVDRDRLGIHLASLLALLVAKSLTPAVDVFSPPAFPNSVTNMNHVTRAELSNDILEASQRLLLSFPPLVQASVLAHLIFISVSVSQVTSANTSSSSVLSTNLKGKADRKSSAVTVSSSSTSSSSTSRPVFPQASISGVFANTSSLLRWRENLLQFVADVCSHTAFSSALANLSRRVASATAGSAIRGVLSEDEDSESETNEDEKERENRRTAAAVAEEQSNALATAFSSLIARLLTLSAYADAQGNPSKPPSSSSSSATLSVVKSTNSKSAHWVTISNIVQASCSSLIAILVTSQFTNVFSRLFKYAVPSAAMGPFASAASANDVTLPGHDGTPHFVAPRGVLLRRLLQVLLERVRLERDRAHAETFLHLVDHATGSMRQPSKAERALNRTVMDDDDDGDDVDEEDPEDDDVTMDLLEDREYVMGLSAKQRREARKRMWMYTLRKREAALMELVPVLTSSLFFPFLVSAGAAKNSSGKYVPTEIKADDLTTLQIATLCIDELVDVACLLLAPLSSPQAALEGATAAAPGSEAAAAGRRRRHLLTLPAELTESLIAVFVMLKQVSKVAARETFNPTPTLSPPSSVELREGWPLVLSSSLLCAATLVSRLHTSALRFLPEISTLTLAILDTLAARFDISQVPSTSGDKEVTSTAKKPKVSDQLTEEDSLRLATLAPVSVETLQLAALSVQETLLRVCPSFMSPYLHRLLVVLTHPCLPERSTLTPSDLRLQVTSSQTQNTSLTASSTPSPAPVAASVWGALATGGLVSRCLTALARNISPRLLLPALFSTWPRCVKYGHISVCRLTALLARVCSALRATVAETSRTKNEETKRGADGEDDQGSDDEELDLSDAEERDVGLYLDSIMQFIMNALTLRSARAAHAVTVFTSISAQFPELADVTSIFVYAIKSSDALGLSHLASLASAMDDDISVDNSSSSSSSTSSSSSSSSSTTHTSLASWALHADAGRKLCYKPFSWCNSSLAKAEAAATEALVQLVLKVNEPQLLRMFSSLTDWVALPATGDVAEDASNQTSGLSPELRMATTFARALPRILPYARVLETFAKTLHQIFAPYIATVLDPILSLLAAPPKLSSADKKALRIKNMSETSSSSSVKLGVKRTRAQEAMTVTEAMIREAMMASDDNFIIWRAQSASLVISAIRYAIAADTDLARLSSSALVFTKDPMEKIISAVAQHIATGYKLRHGIAPSDVETDEDLAYPVFAEGRLVPCLGQISAHLGYSNPALWDSLLHHTLAQTKHKSASVRFAALSALHQYLHENKEDFLMLLPKIVPSLSELMQDDNVLVEKLTQDVIRTIEQLSGESLSQYFK